MSSASKPNGVAKTIQEEFAFLVSGFSCKVVFVERDPYGTYVGYQNNTTGIRVSHEPREGGIFVKLCRLVEGKFPDQVWRTPQLSCVDILDIATIRDFKNIKKDSTDVSLQPQLKNYAAVLKECAPDVLSGDFSVFDDVAKIVKKRIEANSVKIKE